MSDARLVYSTDGGDQRRHPGTRQPREQRPAGDGIVRVSREKTGRGGKVVTVVRGVPGSRQELSDLARDLKRRCGAGGAVRDDAIEIQGDHRDAAAAYLTERGLRVKLAGG